MGAVPNEDRELVSTPTIEHMWPHHMSMARSLVYRGLNPGELAKVYGYTPSQVSVIMNSPCFMAEVQRLMQGVDKEGVAIWNDLHRLAERAIEVLDEDLQILPVGNPVRQRAAFDVLDRTGYGTKKTARPMQISRLTLIKQEVKDKKDEELLTEVMDLVEGDFEDVNE